MNQFTALGLGSELISALDEVGIHSPTEIQAKAIPMMLEFNPDFIGIAQTGTGKTAAFLLPLLQLVNSDARETQALIIAPTRELVQQIHAAFVTFKKYLPKISSAVVYGGTPVHRQASELKKNPPQILMGTPGRLIDLIDRKAIKLNTCRYLILDEADEMLNMGFQEDVDNILKFTNEDRKIWLFSATMPSGIRNIINKYMESPMEVRVRQQQRTNENIAHEYILVDRRDKLEALKRIIDYIDELYCVIFCKTKMDTQELSDILNRDGYKASAIHGDLSQQQRNQVLRAFKSGAVNILVATDVVARGIDIDDLTHVIHYTLPMDREYYTHRSGRTARAGKKGTSLAIVSPADQRRLRQFESSLKINIQKIDVPRRSEVEDKRLDSWLEQVEQAEISTVEFSVKAIQLLENHTKEELLAKLISRELAHAKAIKGKDDLNLAAGARSNRRDDRRDRGRDGRRGNRRDRDRDRYGDRDRRSDRDRGNFKKKEFKGKKPSKSSGGYVPIFVNLGKVDGLTKGALLKIISKEAGYGKSDVGDIHLSKRHSIFELKDKKARHIEKDFRKLKYNGRKIEVRLD